VGPFQAKLRVCQSTGAGRNGNDHDDADSATIDDAVQARHRAMTIASAGESFGIDKVAEDLAMAFGGGVRRDVIERVVLSARRDLAGEVPPAALAEFTHRAARQRLADLRGPASAAADSVTAA
jgi:hypothetical protein